MMQMAKSTYHIKGFTLIEAMVTVAVLAILAAVAAPYLGAWIDKQRVVGASQAVIDQIQTARSEAIKQSSSIAVTISPSSVSNPWYVGVSKDSNACTNDTTSTACLRVTSGNLCKGCTMVTPTGTTATTVVYSFRGTSSPLTGTTITLQSGLGKQIQITASPMGLITTCSPATAAVSGYTTC